MEVGVVFIWSRCGSGLLSILGSLKSGLTMNTKKMKNYRAGILVTLLVAALALPPSTRAVAASETKAEPNAILTAILDKIGRKYEEIMPASGTILVDQVAAARKAPFEAAMKKRIDGLKNGTIQPDQLRNELVTVQKRALEDQKKELFQQVHSLPAEQLDELAETFKGNDSYADARQEYQAAYTRTEKANALVRAAFVDLDHTTSLLVKRSTSLTKEGLIQDLTASKREMLGQPTTPSSAKGRKMSDRTRRLLIVAGVAAAGVLAVGLISWGVSSAVYGGQYGRHKNDLDNQFDSLKKQLDGHYSDLNAQLSQHYNQTQTELQNRYNDLNNSLTQQESDYLNQNGFVYMTCATYQMPDAILCNNYNYQVISGTQYCTVSCYKNVATGQETLHAAPTCTSPFIPADCYNPAEYTHGVQDGTNQGRADGNYDGTNAGASQGHTDGSADGYNDGYNDGYDSRYTRAYNDAYDSSYYTAYNSNYTKGYNAGYSKGYSAGYDDYIFWNTKSRGALKLASSLDDDFETQGFNKGYTDGVRDVKMTLALTSRRN